MAIDREIYAPIVKAAAVAPGQRLYYRDNLKVPLAFLVVLREKRPGITPVSENI